MHCDESRDVEAQADHGLTKTAAEYDDCATTVKVINFVTTPYYFGWLLMNANTVYKKHVSYCTCIQPCSMAYKLSQFISFDSAMAVTISLSCVWTLIQAYQDGSGPLERQSLAKNCVTGERRLQLTPILCRRLERVGYLVIDDFLTLEEVRRASKCIEKMELTNSFQVTPNERDASSCEEEVRTDRVCFFRGHEDSPSPLNSVRHLLRSVGLELTQSDFKGFTNEATGEADRFLSKDSLCVPDMMQVSIYDGIRKDDMVVGAYYRSHMDACSDTIQSLGLLGYLKSYYLRKRYLTCIVYLNENWDDSHGGCLRVFPGNGEPPVDIEPMAGRLVIFSSVNTLHAVLPTFSKRQACSVWLTLMRT